MARKSKKKTQKKAVNNLKNTINRGMYSGHKVAISTISRLRSSYPSSKYGEMFQYLRKFPSDVHGVLLPENLRDIRDLFSSKALSEIGLNEELKWTSLLIKHHSELLKTFRNLSLEYSSYLLEGLYDKAFNTLETIESKTGASMWLISSRIALFQISGGLESQKEYVEKIKDLSENGSILGFVAHYKSESNEDEVDSGRFHYRFKKYLDNVYLPEDLKGYVQYRVLGGIQSGEESQLASLLRVESRSSIVDVYETFLEIFHHILVNGMKGEKRTGEFAAILGSLSVIEDSRIGKMLLLLNAQSKKIDFLIKKDVEADSYYQSGEYESAIKAANNSYGKHPLDFSLIVTAARSYAQLGIIPDKASSLRGKIICLLSSLYLKGEGSYQSAEELDKLARNFIESEISNFLFQHVYKEINFQGISDAQLNLVGAVNCRYLNPAEMDLFQGEARELFRKECINSYGSTASMKFYSIAYGFEECDSEELLSNDSLSLAKLIYLQHIEDFEGIHQEVNTLRKSNSIAVKRTASIYNTFALITEGNLDEAVEVVAKACMEEITMRHYLPLEEIVTKKKWRDFKSLNHYLALSVVIDLFLRDTDEEGMKSTLRIVWDEFRVSAKVARFSELVSKIDEYDHDQLIYALRYISVPNNMNINLTYDGSKAVEEERRSICVSLIELDPINKSFYEDEIVEITRRHEVESGLRQFDQSRIYVDTDAIKQWANREVLEGFNRYQAVVSTGVDDMDVNFSQAMADYYKEKEVIPTQFFSLPKGKGIGILLDIVDRLRDEFLNNSRYGLEGFLSLRVRHGSLGGHLRAPLEDSNLLTIKNNDSGYKPNEFWINKLGALSQDQVISVNKAFARFSKYFDSQSEHLIGNISHIYSEERPKGIYRITPTHYALILHTLNEVVKQEGGFDEFIQETFNYFWFSLSPCLERMREILQNEVKSEVVKNLRKLQEELDKIVGVHQTRELNTAINAASTNFQIMTDKVAGWFTIGDTTDSSIEYSINQVVDIAIQSVKEVRRTFMPKITKNIKKDIPLAGPSFAPVVDTLFIILDNISRYSEVEDGPWVKITIDFNEGELPAMVIRVESEVGVGVRTETREKELDEIRSVIKTGKLSSRVNKEGKSGLIKISNIAIHSNQKAPCFGFVDNDSFFVEVALGSYFVEGDEK